MGDLEKKKAESIHTKIKHEIRIWEIIDIRILHRGRGERERREESSMMSGKKRTEKTVGRFGLMRNILLSSFRFPFHTFCKGKGKFGGASGEWR